MKNIGAFIVLVVLALGCSDGADPSGKENTFKPSMAYQWGKTALEATANDTERFRPRPTVTSRMLGLTWTAVFDAWSRFDAKANPVYLRNVERRPEGEHTLKNKEIAISYAAYRSMLVFFYSDSVMLRDKMKSLGLDPNNSSLDPTTPEGIGNLAAQSVIENRLNDGSNQKGDMSGSNGKAYADYTNYRPINSADTVNELSHWQPKYFSDGNGGRFAPGCLTPHWGNVKPLMLDSASQFRSIPPPALGSPQLLNELKEVVELQAKLTPEEKALVEFMRDGPKSVQQAGHWLIFAQDVSERDHHTLDQDVKLYFLVEAAAMDAFIASWDTKMTYDFARPYSLIHHYYKNKTIKGWAGPDAGMKDMPGQEWRPYSPETFLCPPFPSYISGHSSVSGACAEVLRLFTGSDTFGIEIKRRPGEMTEPTRAGEEITLKFATFTETAERAGMSRVLGGYHIQCENKEGLKLGRNIAAAVWKKYLNYTGQ